MGTRPDRAAKGRASRRRPGPFAGFLLSGAFHSLTLLALAAWLVAQTPPDLVESLALDLAVGPDVNAREEAVPAAVTPAAFQAEARRKSPARPRPRRRRRRRERPVRLRRSASETPPPLSLAVPGLEPTDLGLGSRELPEGFFAEAGPGKAAAGDAEVGAPPPAPRTGVPDLRLRSKAGRAWGVRRFGGSAATEQAVENGLRWLAAAQERDGHWSTVRWGGHQEEGFYSLGASGLAALAFLGAGHTAGAGRYANNVRRAIYWLKAQQQPNGRFSKNNYANGIAAYAVLEHCALTGADRPEATRALAGVLAEQNRMGSWDYQGRTLVSDTSIAGWQVMALKSAQLLGLSKAGPALERARGYYRRAALLEGEGTTAQPMITYRLEPDSLTGQEASLVPDGRRVLVRNNFRYLPRECLLPAGLTGMIMTGWDRDHPWVLAAAATIREDGPMVGRDRRFALIFREDRLRREEVMIGEVENDYYQCYYGTLAMFHLGGDFWPAWNEQLQARLLPLQEAGGPQAGSWPQVRARWTKPGGRACTTAMAVLSLEIYYRYLPVFLEVAGEN